MNFPILLSSNFVRSRVYALAPLSLLVLALGMTACDNSTTPDATDFDAGFTRSDTTAAPDSIYWRFAGATGFVTVAPDQKSYSVSVHVAKNVSKDILYLDLKTLSITTYRLQGYAGQDVSQISFFSRAPDSIANRLFVGYTIFRKTDTIKNPWNKSALQGYYAGLLLTGEARFRGYPGNCPAGIDTVAVDSLILTRVIAAKDSVGKYSPTWGLNWTTDQVKSTYRRWIGTGFIRQGQYDTLFPFDDLPPTQVRAIGFSGTMDSTAIERGTAGVNVVGSFADDSGIIGQTVRILSKSSGDDVTQKFTINAADFPVTPQKTWDLKNHLGIKSENAPNGAYTLEISLRDRKNQILKASYLFYVYQAGGASVDTIPPAITPILPAVHRDTVLDTVTLYHVRIGINDVNLKAVLLDGLPTVPVDGVIEKNIRLVEGTESLVTIGASDSFGNTSSDTIRVYRPKAVPPVVTRLVAVSGVDSVSDTTSTYEFKWSVNGVNVDSVTVGGVSVLLSSQKVADRVMSLSLGATTMVKIRVVDRLRHVTTDSIQVYRPPSVPPLVVRKGFASGVITVPDTLSLFAAAWTVSDNNLDSIRVGNATALLVDGAVSTVAYLKAGDTTRILVWVKDKLGSVSADTVKVWRPDPRKPYLSDIAAVQRGDSVVPLTDFVIPNIRFGRFEVATDLYAKVMRTVAPPSPGLPVANVSIYDAMLFCNAMSKAAGLDTFYTYTSRDVATGFLAGYAVRSDTISGSVIRKGYRLPTATEWDALAASWSGPYPWGASVDTTVVRQYANWNANGPTKAGSLQPTAFGVFDLAGNAGEWVYKNHGNTGILSRWLVRGGDYSSTTPAGLGSVDTWQDGTYRSATIGFRVIRVGQN